jgi:hypothetical protein
MNKFYLKVKCTFCKHSIGMPYEEVYFQRSEDDHERKRKQKEFPKKS